MFENGWALAKERKSKRFNSKQTTYLKEKFLIGEKSSSKKANPVVLAEKMKTEKDRQGRKLFTTDEYLDKVQIAAYFNRLNA